MFKNGMRPVHPGEVLREDYIRNQVVLEAKLDNVVDKLTEIYKMESQKK